MNYVKQIFFAFLLSCIALANVNAASGSGIVSQQYLAKGVGAVPRTLADKAAETVSVNDYGFSKTATAAQNSAAFAAAWTVSKTLQIAEGSYDVCDLPNFAVRGARLRGIGRVVLNYKCAGNGLVVDAGLSAVVPDVAIENITISGTASAKIGLYIRGITHSHFSKIRAINFPTAAMKTDFTVSNTYADFVYSGNEPGITVPTKNGIVLDKRGAGEQSSNGTFTNIIIEGTTGDGIVLQEAIANSFVGGTSEGNGTQGGGGIFISENSSTNSFTGIDLESNGMPGDVNSYHIKNYGVRNQFIAILADSDIAKKVWIAGGNSTMIKGGQLGDLVIDTAAKNTVTIGVAVGGTITDAGTDTRRMQTYYINSATTEQDSIIKTGTWNPTVTNLNTTATPTITATYQKVGRIVYFAIYINANAGVSTSATNTTFSLPFPVAIQGTVTAASDGTGRGLGSAIISGNVAYVPVWTSEKFVVITGQYFTQ